MNHQLKRRRVPVHGVLLLDKPAGMSSTQALAKAKWLLNAEKAGHTGTLDPFATGLLPLCFGEATKYASDLLDADKSYEATVHLGVTTSTGDTEGEVLEIREVHVNREQVDRVLSHFRGKISQTPPMYSALKVDGKPLYAYAREGITLERKAREILIHDIELLEFDFVTLKIRVRCSKGTYVRVLGEDMAKLWVAVRTSHNSDALVLLTCQWWIQFLYRCWEKIASRVPPCYDPSIASLQCCQQCSLIKI
jgi:tRNA pseudouridine55 synthase